MKCATERASLNKQTINKVSRWKLQPCFRKVFKSYLLPSILSLLSPFRRTSWRRTRPPSSKSLAILHSWSTSYFIKVRITCANESLPRIFKIEKPTTVEFFTVMKAQIMIFWVLTPYSNEDRYQSFGETCALHFVSRLLRSQLPHGIRTQTWHP